MKVRTMLKTTLLTTGLIFGAAAAQAAVISFEGAGSHGTAVTSITSDDGLISATVSASGGQGEARIFDTTLSGTADPDLEAPFLNDLNNGISGNPGNVLIIQEADRQSDDIADDNRSGGTITFSFLDAVTFTGFTILDDATITITSDTGASLSRNVDTDSQFNSFDFGTEFVGVQSLIFDFNGESGAIDDLRFLDPFVAPVPVPAALPMMLAGLGGLAWVARRRRLT